PNCPDRPRVPLSYPRRDVHPPRIYGDRMVKELTLSMESRWRGSGVSMQQKRIAVAAVVGLFAAAMMAPAFLAIAVDNPIVIANQQPGSTGWQLSPSMIAADAVGQIKGYASVTSVNQNESITLYVTVNPAQTFTIDIYRMGWYGGLGGSPRFHAGPLRGLRPRACVPD